MGLDAPRCHVDLLLRARAGARLLIVSRLRGARLAAAGLVTAVALLLVAQQPAGASSSTEAGGSVTFVDTAGRTVSCEVDLFIYHNTDDADQPYTSFSDTFISSGDPTGTDCRAADATITVTYTDSAGHGQHTYFTGEGPTSGSVAGTTTNVHVTGQFVYNQCDSSRSVTCGLTLDASPK